MVAVNASVFSLSPNTFASLFVQVFFGWAVCFAIMLFYSNPAIGLAVLFGSIRWIPMEISRISRNNALQNETEI
jgi:hypothetical protein